MSLFRDVEPHQVLDFPYFGELFLNKFPEAFRVQAGNATQCCFKHATIAQLQYNTEVTPTHL